jgi:ribosome-binding protein aMBF1 (putative translation factor)
MKKTRDFAQVLRRKIKTSPKLAAAVRREAFHAEIAQQIYDARTAAGLTQAELAQRIRTQQSVIARLEDADYSGRSLTMLRKIAEALGGTLEVRFKVGRRGKAAARAG